MLDTVLVAPNVLQLVRNANNLQVYLHTSDLALKLHHCDGVCKHLQDVELFLDFVEVEVLEHIEVQEVVCAAGQYFDGIETRLQAHQLGWVGHAGQKSLDHELQGLDWRTDLV